MTALRSITVVISVETSSSGTTTTRNVELAIDDQEPVPEFSERIANWILDATREVR